MPPIELTLEVAPARSSTAPAAAPGRSLTMTVSGSYGAADALPATTKNSATAHAAHSPFSICCLPLPVERRGILPLEANLAVSACTLGGEVGVLQALHRRLEELAEPLQPAPLRTQLEQSLLGLEVEVERGGHAVGVELGEVVFARSRVGHLLDEVGVAVAGLAAGLLGVAVVLLVQQLHVAGGVGHVVDAAHEQKGPRPLYEDVHPAVLHPLEQLRHPRRAAGVLEFVVGEPDDAEL